VQEGKPVRAHLEGLLKLKRISADTAREIARLTGPECPESMETLLGWAWELDRTRWGPDGRLPFSYPMVESWARMTGRQPTTWEVDGLFRVDIAMRSPLAGGGMADEGAS
jgi:hypothetical protein